MNPMQIDIGEMPGTSVASNVSRKRTESVTRFLRLFIKWSWIFIGIAGVLQLAFWPTKENFFAVTTIVISWSLLVTFMLKYHVLRQYPLSSFMVLGLVISQCFLPLVFTLLEGHPVTFNLRVPLLVFLHSLLAVIVVIAAHFFYRTQLKKQPFFHKAIQKKLIHIGFFRTPSDSQIWIMGWIGLSAMFYVYFYSPSVGNEVSGVGNKFFQGFIPFTYAPFYILIKRMYSGIDKRSKKLMLQLAFFVMLLFIVSIGRNSRGAFMFGFTGLGFGYFLGLLLGIFPSKILTRRNLIIAAVSFWLVTGPLSDLGVAMVIVRGQRSNVDRIELLELTFEKFQNKKELADYKENMSGQGAEWDEQYLDNIFLARFCNLKFNDASLEISERLGGVDPAVTTYAIERPMALFPQPVIDLFGIEVDKQKVNSSSSGDFLYERVGGNALGGFRVGHFAGFGMASFGWFYLLLLFVLIIPVFFLWDLLALRFRPSVLNKRNVIFGLGGLLSLTALFQFIMFENVLYITQFLIRGWIQMVFLYWVIFQFTRIVSGFFIKR